MTHDDFAFEPIDGLPERPPAGEQILWQGAPRWRALAWRAIYVRPVVIYFAVLMGWRVWEALSAGGSPLAAVAYAAELLPFAAAALGVLALIAWGYARSTIYTITSQRLVVRSGVALPITVNIPFRLIDKAGVKVHGDGTGDIPLVLSPDANISRLALWPHYRPWLFSRTEPMLRGVRNPQAVAKILSQALVAAVGLETAAASKVASQSEVQAAPAAAPSAGAGQPAASQPATVAQGRARSAAARAPDGFADLAAAARMGGAVS